MESMSGSVVVGNANTLEDRLAVTAEQMTERAGKRGCSGDAHSSAGSNRGVAFARAESTIAAIFPSAPAATAELPMQPPTQSTSAANACCFMVSPPLTVPGRFAGSELTTVAI